MDCNFFPIFKKLIYNRFNKWSQILFSKRVLNWLIHLVFNFSTPQQPEMNTKQIKANWPPRDTQSINYNVKLWLSHTEELISGWLPTGALNTRAFLHHRFPTRIQFRERIYAYAQWGDRRGAAKPQNTFLFDALSRVNMPAVFACWMNTS